MNFINLLLTHTPLFYFTQSVWRDEAFSIFYASQNFFTILTKSVLEPPLFYLMLHVWMKIFGTTDMAARSLSIVGFTLTIILLIEWASKRFQSRFLQLFIPALFAVNPMALYYAFEVRAYTWYLFFFVLSFVMYDTKRWKLFTLATLCGFFTHYYSAIFTIALAAHYGLTHVKSLRSLSQICKDKFFRSLCIIVCISLPQVIRVIIQLRSVGASWYYPVDFHLIKSVLGNMFLGFEGTPWYLWPQTANLSILLFIVMMIPLFSKKFRDQGLNAFLIVFLPLISIIGLSFFKPYFVNRYLIPVVFGQILLVAYAVSLISIRRLKIVVGTVVILLLFVFNMWYPIHHPKVDYRSSLRLANMIKTDHGYIYAEDALNFFETLFYAKDRTKVRLYNPDNSPFPRYIGDSIFFPSYNASIIPSYPEKAVLIKMDGTVGLLTTVPPIKKQ